MKGRNNHRINNYQEKNICRQKFLVSIISMEYINDPCYLKIESVRLDTFHTWPLNGPVSREEVARQGFYYTGHNDAVACVFCRGHLEKWVHTDVVSTEHSKWFPDCPFVQGRECGNVPRQNTNPKIPAYTYFYDRLDSFSNNLWSKADNISADKMASAGFFYIGPFDRVQCFNCGLKLNQWETTDNAWEEHKKYKWNQCSFLMERYNCYLSRQLFTECSLLNQNPFRPSRRPEDRLCKLSREESLSYLSDIQSKEILKRYSPLTELHLSSPSNKPSVQYETLYQPSLNPSQVYMAPTTSTHENLSKSTETLAAAAREPEPVALAKSQVSMAIKDVTVFNPKTSIVSASSSGQESVTSTKSSSSIEIESLRQQLAKLENEVYCKICFENHIEIVFKPCKHMVCCIECSKSQNHCPICRTEINEKERIYRP